MPPSTRTNKPAEDPPGDDDQAAAAAPVTPSPALFVSEGTRQDLLSGARAYDFSTGRELTLDGDHVRFATDAEIEARGKPGAAVNTTDTAALNPS